MYQIFGDEVYDSEEIIQKLENNESVLVVSDLTKSVARQDTIALKCKVSIDTISTDKLDMTDVDTFIDIMQKCEDYVDNMISSLKVKFSMHKIRAYKYDEVSRNISFIICIMYIETARKKMNDVFKRLIKNND